MKKEASLALSRGYVLSGNGEFGEKLLQALAEAPVHSGRRFVELFVDGNTGELLEVLSHSPARIFQQSLDTARSPSRYGPSVTILTLIFDASTNHLIDIALLDRVSAAAYGTLTAWLQRPDTSTRIAA